jgi:hypothetical protein
MAPSQLTCQTRIRPQLSAKAWETKMRSNLECTIPEAILPGLRQNADISSGKHDVALPVGTGNLVFVVYAGDPHLLHS